MRLGLDCGRPARGILYIVSGRGFVKYNVTPARDDGSPRRSGSLSRDCKYRSARAGRRLNIWMDRTGWCSLGYLLPHKGSLQELFGSKMCHGAQLHCHSNSRSFCDPLGKSLLDSRICSFDKGARNARLQWSLRTRVCREFRYLTKPRLLGLPRTFPSTISSPAGITSSKLIVLAI